jgi:two-component system LytT family sensor kinase
MGRGRPLVLQAEPFTAYQLRPERSSSRLLAVAPSHAAASTHAASLVNITGFVAGTTLYAMLLVMVLRPRSTSQESRADIDSLLVLTAVLGLVWNIEAFVSNGLRDFGVPPLSPLVQALAFASLGLLPAVVVHSVLRTGLSRLTSPAALLQVLIAYALSGCAALIQIGSALQGSTVPVTAGLRLLTIGFSALIVPLAIVTRRQPGARRALWMTALAVFAVSALHLSQQEQLQLSWPVELIGHHASLPLVLSILYQEYPFAFADVFLKRALALVALMTTALVAYVTMESSALLSVTRESGNVPALLFLGVSLGTALLFPALLRASTWFVDSVVLRRVDYDLLRARTARRLAEATTPTAALDIVTQAIGPALSASSVRWHETSPQTDTDGLAILNVPSRGISADVTVPTTDRPRFVILVRDLRGGRRLLSDDIAMLESIAQLLGRRVDAIRIERERQEQSVREEEIRRLASEAELRALRAQINPHFLFNALTTIGHLIDTAPDRALTTLLRLTQLLRRVLRSDGPMSTLDAELSLITAYLDIEGARFEERLSVEIDVPVALHSAVIPPLLILPLVENAIKHGIAPFHRRGRLVLRARLDPPAGHSSALIITVQDSGPGLRELESELHASVGVGLRNIEERLEHVYGDAATLNLTSSAGMGTTAELRLPFASSSPKSVPMGTRHTLT